MTESNEDLDELLDELISPGARGQLVAKGLARGMIWRDGVLPPNSPRFPATLTEDLLDHGYLTFQKGLELRWREGATTRVTEAMRVAGEAIEAVVRRGRTDDPLRGFDIVVAAAAFHLGGFAARSYSLLPDHLESTMPLSSSERVLLLLMRRSLSGLARHCVSWLGDERRSDKAVAARLRDEEDDFETDDAIAIALNRLIHRAAGLFDTALHTGNATLVDEALEVLDRCQEASALLNNVPLWWTSTLFRHIIDDLWSNTLHVRLPIGDGANSASEDWSRLRRDFIALLAARRTAEVDLWPSQLAAVARSVDPADDLVVALPTGAGKTRIAELAILRCLADGLRVVYVTPLRALSAQLERVLGDTFRPLGFTASSLYGAAGVTVADVGTLKSAQIVVATPEKLDFATRQDPAVIDDVGLVVLDEGHMIGFGSREIRYEVLVQRLLRRQDADERRIICLSAIFSEGEGFDDFTAWLRSDELGTAVTSDWRPTRQRFGVLRWLGSRGRLDLEVDAERPFVPTFVRKQDPRGNHRNPRPNNRAEFIAASIEALVNKGHSVLVYCPIKKHVESTASSYIQFIESGYAVGHLDNPAAISRAVAVGVEWLGADHVAVAALEYGIAVHHGGLPRQFLTEVETLLNQGVLRIVIASPTVAQGLDLSCSALLFQSIYRRQDLIPQKEFDNVVGRAGRAYVDLDGLIVFPVYEPGKSGDGRISDFMRLKEGYQTRRLESGLFTLIQELLRRLEILLNRSGDELREYVLNRAETWEPDEPETEETAQLVLEIKVLTSELDAAILAMVDDLACDRAELADLLDACLAGSLWMRRLARQDEAGMELQKALIQGRAGWIWDQSTPAQRRGYFAGGLGFTTGRYIDDNLDTLLDGLVAADGALSAGDTGAAVAMISGIADTLFAIEPFVPDKDHDDRNTIIDNWIRGASVASLRASGQTSATQFIQDALVYRLVWGVEAVRVHALALGDPRAGLCTGATALSLTFGLPSTAGCLLVQAGLPSRLLAGRLVEEMGANFTDMNGLRGWFSGVAETIGSFNWDDEEQRRMWEAFVDRMQARMSSVWERTTVLGLDVDWRIDPVAPSGGFFRLLDSVEGGIAVCDADLTPLGSLADPSAIDLSGLSLGKLSEDGQRIDVSRFGPIG